MRLGTVLALVLALALFLSCLGGGFGRAAVLVGDGASGPIGTECATPSCASLAAGLQGIIQDPEHASSDVSSSTSSVIPVLACADRAICLAGGSAPNSSVLVLVVALMCAVAGALSLERGPERVRRRGTDTLLSGIAAPLLRPPRGA